MNRMAIGTTKGLIYYTRQNNDWKFESIHFKGLAVSMIHHAPAQDLWWVGLSSKHWGPKLFRSSGQSNQWQACQTPQYPAGAVVKPGQPASTVLIWSGLYQPSMHRLWIGTDPGGLFYSDDGGMTHRLCKSLWHHPSRPDHWFGGGRNHAGIHTILANPDDAQNLWIGVSCAGVFQTTDGGLSWTGQNRGLKAEYLPDPFTEFGHDPHDMKICEAQPRVMWQQNHCGVFRSIDQGSTWSDVTDKNGWGRYGFAIVIDHNDPQRAWIIPAESDEQRMARNQRLVVCMTEDGGRSWAHKTKGLPQEHCFDLVFRHAFDRYDHTMVFGSTTGNLFCSDDDGDSWQLISQHLPPIHVIKAIGQA